MTEQKAIALLRSTLEQEQRKLPPTEAARLKAEFLDRGSLGFALAAGTVIEKPVGLMGYSYKDDGQRHDECMQAFVYVAEDTMLDIDGVAPLETHADPDSVQIWDREYDPEKPDAWVQQLLEKGEALDDQVAAARAYIYQSYWSEVLRAFALAMTARSVSLQTGLNAS